MNNKEQKKLSEEEWKKRLTPEQYKILREKGTEPPFTGKYNKLKDKGTFYCAACGNPLFSSETKYDSGSGWPSFWEPIEEDKVMYNEDVSHGMRRTEILCSQCESHLGHLFEDGPEPTGERFCVNSASLMFKPKEEKNQSNSDSNMSS